MRRRAAAAAAAAGGLLLPAAGAAGGVVTPRGPLPRAALVEQVNRLPGALWRAALGPRQVGTLKDSTRGDAFVRGVLPGYGEHLKELAARGEIRTVSAMDFAMGEWHRIRQNLEYLHEQQEARQAQQVEIARSRGVSEDARPVDDALRVSPAAVGEGAGSVIFADPRVGGELRRERPARLGGAGWAKSRMSLPRDFDAGVAWPHCSHVINNILDQGNCGCCWAFCVAEVASDRLCIATRGRAAVPLSTQNLCFCSTTARSGCDGGWTTQAWFYLRTMGVVTGQQQRFDPKMFPGARDPDRFGNGSYCAPYSLPHCHHHGPVRNDPFPAEGTLGCPEVLVDHSPACPKACDTSAAPPHDTFALDTFSFQGDVEQYVDEGAIMAAITQCGPVTATIDAYDDFEQYVSGVYHRTPNATSKGGHAVKITGYGEDNGVKYWKVANSWNPHWGENGFFRVLRGVNEIGIEDEVTASSCNVQWSTTSSAF